MTILKVECDVRETLTGKQCHWLVPVLDVLFSTSTVGATTTIFSSETLSVLVALVVSMLYILKKSCSDNSYTGTLTHTQIWSREINYCQFYPWKNFNIDLQREEIIIAKKSFWARLYLSNKHMKLQTYISAHILWKCLHENYHKAVSLIENSFFIFFW